MQDNDPKIELILAQDCARFYSDPCRWVLWAFDWGHGVLDGFDGPDVWQREVLEDIGQSVKDRGFDGINAVDPYRYAVSSGHGIGKGHPLSMPYGAGTWGDLKVGDRVFNSDGLPTPIKAVNHYQREHYLVTFDDGSTVTVSGQHEWNVRGRNHRRRNIEGWETVETCELMRRGVKRPNGASMARQWEIPIHGAVQYSPCSVGVDAYTYGVWLGDGDKRGGRITNVDGEVWDNVAYPWNPEIKGITKTLLGLKSDLVANGLFGCTTYTASVDSRYVESRERLAVLQGLLDTDGWVEQCGSAAFCSASHQLVADVVKIARSLGLKARKEKFKNNDCAGAWQTHITWDGSTQLFRIKRKQSRLVRAEHRYQCRWIDSIESAGLMDGMCIEVDGGLYLTDDFHVTHNSALTAWIILWLMSTRPHAKGIVTANTSDQLKTKTWAELGKWRSRCLTGHWFEYNSGRGSMAMYHEEYPESWRVDAQTCREENSEAFAGLHAANSTPFYILDEASAVPAKIFEVAEGGLTDGEPLICCFGNPTRNSGAFFEAFNRQSHRWSTRQIDSRTAKMTNKALFKQWVDDFGEDSDFVRVRVRGVFPRASDMQFIPSDSVTEAMSRPAGRYMPDEPLICGVDVARGGGDNCYVQFRRGNDAVSEKVYRIPGEKSRDSMKVVSLLSNRVFDHHQPDAIFVDETGLGGPIVDRLDQLGYPVTGVNFGSKADDSKHHVNKVAEMWARMRGWVMKGGSIYDEPQLERELTQREFSHNSKDQLVLEPKDSLKKRGMASPDWADALSLTFAYHVPPRPSPRDNVDKHPANRGHNDDPNPLDALDET